MTNVNIDNNTNTNNTNTSTKIPDKLKDNTKTLIKMSLDKSINVGMAGYIAMTFQVSSLMWLRTTMNYQFKNGGTTKQTLKTLYNEGGPLRFYRGVGFALINAPLARFGDTACNMAALTYLDNSDYNKATKTFIGSLSAGLWRITIIPVDSFKSNLQVHGPKGLSLLRNNIKTNGIGTLYNGCGALYFGTVLGHFPWFYTYNYLQTNMPYKDTEHKSISFLRSGTIGFLSSASSDIVSNSVRVLKISRQTSETNESYKEIVKNIVKKDNITGLFTRGLKTKMIMNGLQGFIFVIVFDQVKKILKI